MGRQGDCWSAQSCHQIDPFGLEFVNMLLVIYISQIHRCLQFSETRSWYVVKSSSSTFQTWTVIWILSMDPITFNGLPNKNHCWYVYTHSFGNVKPWTVWDCFLWSVVFALHVPSRQKVHHISSNLNHEANEGSLQQTCNMATHIKRSWRKFYKRMSIFQLNY